MKIKNINKIITTSGNTADIIHTVMIAYEQDDDQQIAELADELKGNDIRETCRNIWSYLIEKVDYQADAETGLGEMVRTPARLIHDGTGDCKSYSLFTAVVLRYLGVKHFFRFASYSSRPEATHVYIIALDEQGDEICIDAVAYEMKKIDFDREITYTYKCDMSNGTTKISYLAGLSGGNTTIGSTDPDDDSLYDIWLGDEPEDELTPGKLWLYIQADLLNEQLKTTDDVASVYNQLAIITLLINAFNYVYFDIDRMVQIISGMKREGWFESRETDTTLRDEWFNQLTAECERRYESEQIPELIDENLYRTITENVTNQNDIPETISGISGLNPLTSALKKAGIYFIYLFIPDSELKNYPAVVAKKRNTQNVFFTLIHKIDIFHNAQAVKDLFRAGIIARTGMEPEKYISDVKLKNVRTVGIATATLVTISTIIGIIIGLLQVIKMIWPNSQAASYAVSSGAADMQNEVFTTQKKQGEDPGNGVKPASGASLKTLLTMGGIAAAGFFLIGRIKPKK